MASFRRAVVWLRRDLRTSDHAALAAATNAFDQVTVAFVFDRFILDALPDRCDRRVFFIHRSLAEIDQFLRQQGSRLIVLFGDPTEEIPRIARHLDVDAVFVGRDYDPYATTRDREVAERLAGLQKRLEQIQDIVIREPGELKTQSGGDFRVFTPYSRAWRKQLAPEIDLAEVRADWTKLAPVEDALPSLEPIETYGFEPTDLWLEPGEAAAQKRLSSFEPKMSRYESDRNFPATAGTSGLSVDLRFGTISVRECVRRAQAHGAAGEKWLTELIWREFYQDILSNHPTVVNHAFKPEYDDIDWPGEEAHFQAWCAGQTGYPIVDAAMRCLNATGWMHNRLRMIVASFLTKDLLVDWRRGEHYFAVKLLDFELASNNGGWQWAASTGADSQPYFRIFNPLLQSEKFDASGAFIRKWVPELAALDSHSIHDPWSRAALDAAAAGYPRPIVDHATQKARALALLSLGKGSRALTTGNPAHPSAPTP
jgi:deoxyribodipyrimidine photo-lyase